jgi:hypothetical protein
MNDVIAGFKQAGTAKGVGSLLAIFLVFAVLAYLGVTPASAASNVSRRLSGSQAGGS